MPIQFRCSTCRKLLSVARRKAGHDTECPVCGSKTRVPEDLAETPAPGAPPGIAMAPPQLSPAVPGKSEGPVSPTPANSSQVISAPAIAVGGSSSAKPSGLHPKRPSGSSGILEIDPDRLFGKSHAKNPSKNSESLQKPAKELSDYFEAIDRSQEIEDSGSQAVEVPEPFLPRASSWQLRAFAVVLVFALASALVVGFLLIRGW